MKGALVTFIAKVEGVVKEKFSRAAPQTPTVFRPNKNTWRRHCSCVVYKCTCAGCNSVYNGETTRHLTTRVRDLLCIDKNSHIF